MLVMMAVSLFTSRLTLSALGIEDFGIYNVVGGVVGLFGIVSGSLQAAISRFLTFELGAGNKERLARVFCTSINIQAALSVIILLIAETVGLWFLNCKMVIPEGRLFAANMVYQFSLVSCVLGLLNMPYGAAVVSHERMSAFAYMSIFDVVAKLLVVYAILHAPCDKLILFAFLLMLVPLFGMLITRMYSQRHFEECHYHWVFDRALFKEMFGFAGWNFLGNGAFLLNTQGVNVLMNLYFGVSINAARGVAAQVEGAMSRFVCNFTTAVNPQITKSYAAGDLEAMHKLVCRSAKFSAFLMIFFAIPIILETDTILTIWLKNPPTHAAVFLQWVIISSFVDSVLANSLITSMLATGKIKKYQITVTLIGGMVFPLTWLAFELGCPPQMGYIIYFIIYTILLFVRLYLLKGMVKLPIMMYVREVLFKILPVIVIGYGLTGCLLGIMEAGFVRLVVVCIVSTVITAFTSFTIGLSKNERVFIVGKIREFRNKFRR